MTIWVTRWTLGQGTIRRYDKAEATVVRGRKGNRNCAIVRCPETKRTLKFWPGEWHPTPEAARAYADRLRDHALEGLARHAEKLLSFDFKVRP